MAKSFTYTFEDKNGETHDYDVVYSITKGSNGTWEQPPEQPEIEFQSIQCNGMEVAFIDDTILARIEQLIWEDLENEDDYGYGYSDLD
ncbi:MAG: hypothetical protein WCJ62_07455 [Flavobacterium sp.]